MCKIVPNGDGSLDAKLSRGDYLKITGLFTTIAVLLVGANLFVVGLLIDNANLHQERDLHQIFVSEEQLAGHEARPHESAAIVGHVHPAPR